MPRILRQLGLAALATILACCLAAPALADPATPAKTPDTLKDLPTYGEALIRMAVVLVTMLIALFLAAKYLPRWLNKPLHQGKAGAIKVLDSLQLEPRRRIYLVQVGEQVFLLGTSEQGVQLLADRALDSAAMLEKLRVADVDAAGAGRATEDEATLRSFADVLSAGPATGGAPHAATKTGLSKTGA